MIISVSTIAMPEKMAPATKYGGKIVACQPGITAVAKSQLTIVCTEMTSGVPNPASMRYTTSYLCQVRYDPFQPSDNNPAIRRRHVDSDLSRMVARSGRSPTYQNVAETVK